MCTPTQGVWQPAGCVSCELVCVCVSLVRVVIICLASTHTALVSSPSLAVLHLSTYLPTGRVCDSLDAVANCHVGSRSAPLAAGARLIAAPTPRRRRLARRETAWHRRQNKREVATRPRQQKRRRSVLLLFLVSSCRRRTRARSAPLRDDTTTGTRTGDIRAPARTPTDRATE